MTDNELMMLVRNGDVDQLGLLFERHHIRLFNFFVRMTEDRKLSEDLVQEVFLRMLKYRNTYKGSGSFSTWMFQIARNARIDYYRKQKNETTLDVEFDQLFCADSDPNSDLEQRQEVELIKKALQKLSPEKREILILSRYQNIKYEEIAKIQKCKVGTIKAKVHRAIKELGSIYLNLTQERIA